MLSLKMALRSINASKMRAMLTMLGIIIGVVALVVLVSLVSGATDSVTEAVSSLGSDMISVAILDDKGAPVSLEDLDEWTREEPEIGSAAAYATTNAVGKYKRENSNFTVYGVSPSYASIQGLDLCMGRFINSTDIKNNTRVCVLRYRAATELVGYPDCVGEEISLNGVKYLIIGVLAEDESLLTTLLTGSMVAYVPYTSLMRISDSVSGNVTSFIVSASEEYTMEQAEEKMKSILLERLDEDEDAYYVSSTKIMEEAMGDITSILSILLGGIAAISLVVGGIGIMNIMMVTVTERTREIGIRKAIGATRSTILRQFLVEAVVLCMMGCALGIFFSWSILRILSVVVSSTSLTFSLNGTVVIVAVVFCFMIGIIFGLAPANKAAKMKPIDALHYGG